MEMHHSVLRTWQHLHWYHWQIINKSTISYTLYTIFWGVMLTTHPLLVPRLRKSRSYTSCHSKAPLWSIIGPLYLYTIFCIQYKLIIHQLHSTSQYSNSSSAVTWLLTYSVDHPCHCVCGIFYHTKCSKVFCLYYWLATNINTSLYTLFKGI
jgi:hypothetical protein